MSFLLNRNTNMITVRKFWTIVFITIALSFSLLAYADTYWVKGNKVKNKDSTEYLIFNDEHKVQLGFKVNGLNLAPINTSKNDSIRKEIKKREEAAEKAKIKGLRCVSSWETWNNVLSLRDWKFRKNCANTDIYTESF